MTKVYFHVDLDAFFASVEQLDHPEYRGKPVIVGGEIGARRAVVSTCSYEARKFGVHSAMPTFQAVKLCPNGIFVNTNMKRYQEKSREVMSIFYDFSPDVQQMSVDEAFIDMTGTEKIFGTPQEAARKLKAAVLEKTGLTVSVGIASTKYCAKIASGIKKPDGLFEVSPGKELDFMLSLPMEKLWGAGKKTQEKLRNSGITTIREIYNRSLPLLQSIFGNATGIFLYNSCRGREYEDFNTEPKNRSISAETTYEYDLISFDAMETALLELCQTVMFRSLKEKLRSRSISIKIRYEDFSTVSIQEGSQRYVSSADDLFERVKNLFYKKYTKNLGIRLFGVCLQNVEDDTKPRQAELFDFGEEKKRKIEQAILKAEQKDPSIKITKARLLEKGLKVLAVLFIFFAGVSGAEAQNISEEEVRDEQTLESGFQKKIETVSNLHSQNSRTADGAGTITFDTSRLPPDYSEEGDGPSSLFKKEFHGKDIEFLAEGYWKSTISAGGSYSFGFGTTPALSTFTPVFEQNVDLTLWFMADNHWYFEAAFADSFEKNTVAAGYKGDGYLKSARAGNRGILFPSIYAAEDFNRGIGGGENQAPGISFNWKGDRWQSDVTVRYDLLSTHTKSWYGKNAVSTNSISLSQWNSGSQYVLPSSKLTADVKAVYVENAAGNYKDSKGRKYTRLDSTQYLTTVSQNLLLLSRDAKAAAKNGVLPSVAVSFHSDVSIEDLNGLLEDVRSAFAPFHIENYFYDFLSTIDGEKVLFIQHPSGFSPFENGSRYDAGIIAANDVAVASLHSEVVSGKFLASIVENDDSFSAADFFNDSHTYIDVYDSETTGRSLKDASVRFPFAATNPGVYLGISQNDDLVLRIRSYSPVTRFDIGTKAVPGTVQVYRNNVLDSGAEYNPSSGEITLTVSVNSTDHISAFWQEDSEDAQNGSFALGAGFKYDFSENFTANASLTSRISYAQDRSYADSSSSNPTFATLAAGAEYRNDFLSVKNSTAATIETTDSTGTFRILGMDEGDSQTSYLSKKAAVSLPAGFSPKLNDRSGEDFFPELSGTNKAMEVSDGIRDAGISGYAVPFSWSFSAGSSAETQWAAETIGISGAAGILAGAGSFEIALKNSAPETYDYDLYLQLGVSTEDDFAFEDENRIPTWKISRTIGEEIPADVYSGFDPRKEGWQTVKIAIDEKDRAFFASSGNYGARLIATAKTSELKEQNISCAIFAGPYECGAEGFSVSKSEEIKISAYQKTDHSLVSSKIKDFNRNSSNSVQVVSYKYMEDSDETGAENSLRAVKYFGETDFSRYRKLNFYFKYDSQTSSEITFTLDRPEKNSFAGNFDKSVEFKVKSSQFSEGWNKVSVDFGSKTAEINGIETPAFVDTDILPVRFSISLKNSSTEKGVCGEFAVDELYLSDSTAFFTVQDKLTFSFRKNGEIISAGEKALLKDFSVTAKGSASSSTNTGTSATELFAAGNGTIGATIAGLKLSFSASKDSAAENNSALTSASHEVSTASPLLGLASFSEKYSFNSESETLEKENDAKINFSKLRIPLSLSARSKASSDSWSKNQKVSAEANLNIKNLQFDTKTSAEQKISTASTEEKITLQGYGDSWKKITVLEFSSGDEKASKRDIFMSQAARYKFSRFSLSPQLTFSAQGQYKDSSQTEFKDSTRMDFELPFSVRKNNFVLSYSKLSGSNSGISRGGNYSQDFSSLASRINEKPYFFTALPFYDFFSGSLAGKVSKAAKSADSASQENSFTTFYTAATGFAWKRAFSGTKYDFFIPSSARTDFSRDIQSSSTTSDLYQLKQTVNFSSLNIFGSKGAVPVFKFYEQDEFASSLSAALKMPKESPSKARIRISGYNQSILYLNETDTIKTGIEGSVESRSEWDGKITFVLKRQADSSVAAGFYSLIRKNQKKDSKEMKITKSDSFNLGAASSQSSSKIVHRCTAEYSHQTDTQVSKFVTINTAFGAAYAATWNKIAVLNGSLTVGATVKF